MKKLLLFALLIPLACVAAQGQSCTGSDAIQKHIYHPDRLVDDKGCITVKGTIMFKKFEDDGDIHYRLKLDPKDSSLVNAKNIGGFLVFEPICIGPIKPKKNGKPNLPVIAACKGFHQKITLPNKGDKVSVTGIHRLDKDHGWLEIHPVTKITILH